MSEPEKPENPELVPEKLIKNMFESVKKAKETRPDIEPKDLIARVGAPDGGPQSIAEFNASGEEMAFISMRCSIMKEPGVPGSSQVKCDGCGELVWLSPGTLQLYSRILKKKMNCFECVMAEMPPEKRERLQRAAKKEGL